MKKAVWTAILLSGLGVWSCSEKEVDPFATVKPDESRFTKVTLVEKLNEPMEIEVLDNGNVLFIERAGKLKMYDASTGETSVVGELDVFLEHEDGLDGFAIDPNFNENNWVYFYYAPTNYSPDVNRLSRFEFKDNHLDLASEKILLEIPVFRGCCHTGGSIEFDSNGLLYLSTGDDTTPFDSQNFNPIDERQDRPANVDAQRSSGNANDLRGAIIRIKPEADGTYSIPEGNLFPPGTEGTRPEIYVMGNRNPFRISLDQHNGNLYWGEVGPDGSQDKVGRGPRGYDEINVATGPGFFGWPYFVGNNYAYWKYDFEKKDSLFRFDPAAPLNTSPNNTGIQNLPPAQPAMIYYPYNESEEFPMLGSGGRNAMAGPVYYREDFDRSEVRFPGYYNEKLFIYDWMRNWVFTVSLTENYEYDSMERFMPETVFEKPMDMQFGKDGALYVLEYGTFWRSQNDNSGLYKIEFASGNRKPIAKLEASQNTGGVPLKVDFSSEGSIDFDPEDQLSYSWNFGDGSDIESLPHPSHTYQEPGTYQATLTVVDLEGEEASASIEIRVGNERPKVEIAWQGNQSFYFGPEKVEYEVKVTDQEDTEIDPSDIKFSIDYMAGGFDVIETGHQEEEVSVGENFITQAGCKACHDVNNKSVGPTFRNVSSKYKGQSEARDYLVNKIRNGGNGVWGEQMMPGHLHLPEDQVGEMVDFVLSLEDPEYAQENLPLNGVYDINQTENPEGYYLVQASYADQGAHGIESLKGNAQLLIRNSLVPALTANEFDNTAKANIDGVYFIRFTAKDSWLAFENWDVSGIKSAELLVNPAGIQGVLEIRLDSPDGELWGRTELLSQGDRKGYFPVNVSLNEESGMRKVYFVLRSESNVNIWNTFNLDTIHLSK